MGKNTHRPKVKAKRYQKRHEEAVESIIRNLEILGIPGFSLGKLILNPIKFPHIRDNREIETGDIIFIWQASEGEWEIVNIEITTSSFANPIKYFQRMEQTFNYLCLHWKKWFSELNLEDQNLKHLWFRPIFVLYLPYLIGSEKPYVEMGKSKKIF